jgi:DNA-binding response OmpR family regulator
MRRRMKALAFFNGAEGGISNPTYKMLQDMGFNLDLFRNAGEAQRYIHDFRYDLVLLQPPIPAHGATNGAALKRPMEVGIELIKEIREKKRNSRAKIIMMNGLGALDHNNYGEKAMDAGADVYMSGSTYYATLRDKIHEIFPKLSY